MLKWINPFGTMWQLVNEKEVILFTCTEKFFDVLKDYPEILKALEEKSKPNNTLFERIFK